MKQTTLFEVPIWTKKIENFSVMRNDLQRLFDKYPDTKNEPYQDQNQNFYTNRQNPNRGTMLDEFSNIISNEIRELVREMKSNKLNISDIKIKDVWSVTYQKYDYQTMHNHGAKGLTGLLCLDSPMDGPSLNIVQPWNDWIEDRTNFLSAKLEEGGMVVFPSFLLHSSDPNKSDNQKRVISWDMEII